MLHINNDNQFLFIHIPKCAGTSIEKFFGYDYDRKIYIEHKYLQINHPKHLSLNNYEYIFNKELINKIYKFTFIRNPFDFIVSLYNYTMYSDKVMWNGIKDFEYKKNIPFIEYIKYIYNLKYFKEKSPNQVVTYSYNYYIETKNNNMDFIGRYENLYDDFKIVCNELNIINSDLPFNNKSKVNDVNYKNYYNNESKDLVYKIFKDELKKYKYDF